MTMFENDTVISEFRRRRVSDDAAAECLAAIGYAALEGMLGPGEGRQSATAAVMRELMTPVQRISRARTQRIGDFIDMMLVGCNLAGKKAAMTLPEN